MTRPLRLEFPGAIYHVTSRGNAQAAIFLDDEDQQQFLKNRGQVLILFRTLYFSYGSTFTTRVSRRDLSDVSPKNRYRLKLEVGLLPEAPEGVRRSDEEKIRVRP
jgi:hypothetical protein